MSAVTLWGPARRYDPFGEFDALVRRSFGPGTTRRPTGFVPAADVVRDGEDAVVRLELPGVDVASDVTVEVDRDRLVVRGERRDEQAGQGEGDTGHRREVRYGSFRRTFTLPSHVGADAVSASYDAGVLSVRITGAHTSTEPTRIEIAGTAPDDTPETPTA